MPEFAVAQDGQENAEIVHVHTPKIGNRLPPPPTLAYPWESTPSLNSAVEKVVEQAVSKEWSQNKVLPAALGLRFGGFWSAVVGRDERTVPLRSAYRWYPQVAVESGNGGKGDAGPSSRLSCRRLKGVSSFAVGFGDEDKPCSLTVIGKVTQAEAGVGDGGVSRIPRTFEHIRVKPSGPGAFAGVEGFNGYTWRIPSFPYPESILSSLYIYVFF